MFGSELEVPMGLLFGVAISLYNIVLIATHFDHIKKRSGFFGDKEE